MKIFFNLLLAISTFLFFQPAWGAEPIEEARAVFVKMVTAAKANDIEGFKSHILPRDLAEMEKEGATQMVMMMMAEDNPAIFHAEAGKGHIIFTHEIKEEGPGSSSSMKKIVYMIKHEGQWKFGTPQ
ncbi:MAG: hypothetical protein EP297_09490 [Gammaproteobacteria bacterium]|nr:MAG: hypothetical protein EP297_09490 [Gammaproteobacteria bacterium]